MIAETERIRPSKFAYFIVTSFILLLISIIAIFSYIARREQDYRSLMYPNVRIDLVDVGGATKKEVVSSFKNKYSYLRDASITIEYDLAPIATFSAQKLGVKTDIEDVAERAYLIGRVKYFPSRFYQKIATFFGMQTFDFSTHIVFDENVLDEFLSTAEQKYNKPAKNALFKFENNRVVNFRQEEKGEVIESKKFMNGTRESVSLLKDKPNTAVTLILTKKIIDPSITLAKSNQFGIEELIGEGKSDYSHSIPERVHNVILAASKLNGVLIQKDATFSFNETIGDISSSTGYKPAYIIKNGRTVLGDGGGVCQVSTTFFRAALNTGLPIVERTAHAYRVGYYENDSKPGFDATVFAPSVDLKIKNDTPAYILVQTEVDQTNNLLFFKFYGKKDGRRVEISPVTLYDVSAPAPTLYQDDPTLKKGTTKQVDFPAWGGKAYFSYKVFDSKGKPAVDRTFYSNYRPWQAVYLVGTGEF